MQVLFVVDIHLITWFLHLLILDTCFLKFEQENAIALVTCMNLKVDLSRKIFYFLKDKC